MIKYRDKNQFQFLIVKIKTLSVHADGEHGLLFQFLIVKIKTYKKSKMEERE
jgi:hypothetical protein